MLSQCSMDKNLMDESSQSMKLAQWKHDHQELVETAEDTEEAMVVTVGVPAVVAENTNSFKLKKDYSKG